MVEKLFVDLYTASKKNMICEQVCNRRSLIRAIAIFDGGNSAKMKKNVHACL